MPHTLRLYKRERLCSLTAINRLFSPASPGENKTIMAYPWRAVWRRRADALPVADAVPAECMHDVRFLISVPKRKLRHAVDRVTMRRRCREAYRLNRSCIAPGVNADLAFIYIADTLTDYKHTERAVRKILTCLGQGFAPGSNNSVE